AHWRTYSESTSGDENRAAAGYAVGTSTFAVLGPASLTELDKARRATDDIVAKRTSGSGSLSISDTFSSSDYQRKTSRTYADNGRLTSAKPYYSINTPASDDQAFAYDSMGRQVKLTSPGGTITRKTYDARGHVTSISVGTQEEDLTHESNMVLVEEY